MVQLLKKGLVMKKYIAIMFLISGCATHEKPQQNHIREVRAFDQQSTVNTYNYSSCYGNGKISCKIKEANNRLDNINRHLLEIDNTLSCCGD